MRNHLALILLALVVASCSTRTASVETSEVPTTPKPQVACPQADVDNYLDELDLVLEKWEDISVRAESTSRMALSSVIGELQEVRRDTRRLDRPECADFLNDLIVVAMDRDIDSFISFLSQDSDSIVARKIQGADAAWEIVESEISSFEEDPIAAYQSSSVTPEDLEQEIDQTPEFELPDGWTNHQLPASDLVFSIPNDWDSSTYGDEDQFVRNDSPDGSVTFLLGVFSPNGLSELDSDAGRLFSLQTILETSDFDYYLEKSAEVEVHAQNRAYLVEFSARENSGREIQDRVWAVVITPDEAEVLAIAQTSRDEFAQIDLATFRTLLGSFR